MARPPSAAVAARNHEINSLFQGGSSLSELAEQFKLTPQRIFS
jgi:Mor family transcriptional regulator